MSPIEALFVVRVLLVILIYAFLGALFWMLWRDVRLASRLAAVRGRRLGRLVVLESDAADLAPGSAFPLMPITSLGRAPTNTASIPDETASLEHALLHLRDGQWWLEDLASRNGTRLNDTPVADATPVVPGDIIAIGRVRLKVELE
jgi:hypothetical protein